jgi:cytochrome c peroxidase
MINDGGAVVPALGPRLVLVTAAVVALAGCQRIDRLFCGDVGCDLDGESWRELSALADLPPPPPDPSNRYVGNVGAEQLGHQLFYDPRFSGSSLQVDALRRPVSQARAPRGQPINLACAGCHDPARAGVDSSSVPGHVSVGAGWADTNALASFNSAHYTLAFWNGRADSLWAQAALANEGALMNGSRLQTAWVLATFYRQEYQAVFSDHPMPITGNRAEVLALVEVEGPRAGQCALNPRCPTEKGCRELKDATGTASGCWPRFPLWGKPGTKAGCQPGDPAEPWGDAFDCLPVEDQQGITRMLVNFGKAIAAYEYQLVTGEAPFDRWIRDVRLGKGLESKEISEPAKLGARLFVGKAACVDCHNTPFFSDNGFHNVAVAQKGDGVPTEADCLGTSVCDCSPSSVEGRNCLPWGARDGLGKLRKSPMLRDSVWSDERDDQSRQRFVEMALEAIPKGAWRTPGLRGVAMTAPYMHDGALATLEEVVGHYDVGGSPGAPGTPSARMRPLFLSLTERTALVEFMKSLTGEPPPAELISPPGVPQ